MRPFLSVIFSSIFSHWLVISFFFSNFMVEIYSRRRENLIYIIPTVTEAVILATLAITGSFLIEKNPDLIAFSLLFAMGMQNSLVTSISNAVVRTTHLTGLFTDMGIEFSQLFFYKDQKHKKKLIKSIKLRLTIIWLFFAGGVSDGILYTHFGIRTLMFGSLILLLGLLYDFVKIRLLLLRHKLS